MFKHLLGCVAGIGILASALTASAQDARPERPYLGIFGGGIDEFEQVMTVNGSAGGGYDTSPAQLESESVLQPFVVPVTASGTAYSYLSGGLSYIASLKKLSVGSSLSSSMRRYVEGDLPNTPNHAASVASSLNGLSLGKRTSLSGNVAASYQSTRGFRPFPALPSASLGPVETPVADYGTGRRNYYQYAGSAGVTHQFSARSSVSAGYNRQSTKFGGSSDDLTSQGGSIRFTRGITQNLGLRLGYGYTEATYSTNVGRYENHNLDTGVDYNRALSLTRRTRLSFSSGATAVRQDQRTRYDAVGSAILTREIARSWNASLSYLRSVGFVESVLEPVFSDSLSANVGGLVTRRLSVHSGLGASRGSVGIDGRSSNGFDALTGFAGMNQALTRHLALGVSYSYYRYNFESGAALLTRLSPNMNRHSVNVTLNAWAPVFQRGRRGNASR